MDFQGNSFLISNFKKLLQIPRNGITYNAEVYCYKNNKEKYYIYCLKMTVYVINNTNYTILNNQKCNIQ